MSKVREERYWPWMHGNEPEFRLTPEEAKKCWTPCRHYPDHCIGYCPFCVAHLLQLRQDLDFAEAEMKRHAENDARETP